MSINLKGDNSLYANVSTLSKVLSAGNDPTTGYPKNHITLLPGQGGSLCGIANISDSHTALTGYWVEDHLHLAYNMSEGDVSLGANATRPQNFISCGYDVNQVCQVGYVPAGSATNTQPTFVATFDTAGNKGVAHGKATLVAGTVDVAIAGLTVDGVVAISSEGTAPAYAKVAAGTLTIHDGGAGASTDSVNYTVLSL